MSKVDIYSCVFNYKGQHLMVLLFSCFFLLIWNFRSRLHKLSQVVRDMSYP